ncbi:hypothetical protein MLD38_009942 [Melastoma candidum]|uniref:Uncharacterized protein n=1 Tax=Melastoma candidum TaxID=119954 RepID=A0ACB9R1T4_9MYRT|nr:hypothetical protein MLD38_009942 [Melastoma candidum]
MIATVQSDAKSKDPSQEESHYAAMAIEKRRGRMDWVCDHCGKKGHLKEKCFYLVGFPPNTRFGRGMGQQYNQSHGQLRGRTQPVIGRRQINAVDAEMEGGRNGALSSQLGLSKQQIQKLVAFLAVEEQSEAVDELNQRQNPTNIPNSTGKLPDPKTPSSPPSPTNPPRRSRRPVLLVAVADQSSSVPLSLYSDLIVNSDTDIWSALEKCRLKDTREAVATPAAAPTAAPIAAQQTKVVPEQGNDDAPSKEKASQQFEDSPGDLPEDATKGDTGEKEKTHWMIKKKNQRSKLRKHKLQRTIPRANHLKES